MDKKDIVIAILVLLLIILGVSFVQKNEQDNLVFENNIRCAQYINQQNKEINEIANLPVNGGKVVTAPKVFFSKKLNTCVSAYSIEDFRGKGFSSFYINNLLNNDSIFMEGGSTEKTTNGDSLANDASQKFYAKLKEIE